MRDSWLRRLTGRSLLRGRPRPRARPIGTCARCGDVLLGPSDGWFDADRAVNEHAIACPVPTPAAEVRPHVGRPVLRPA